MQATAFLDLPHYEEFSPMGKRIQVDESAKTTKITKAAKEEGLSFGQRLASLRKAAGFTQNELAAELGISQRMVAYYGSPAATPPANLLPLIATALGADDRCYVRAHAQAQAGPSKKATASCVVACWPSRSLAERCQVLQVIDAFIERGQSKRKAESRA